MQKRKPYTEERRQKLREAMLKRYADKPKVDRAAYMRDYRKRRNPAIKSRKPRTCRQTERAIEHAAIAEMETVEQFIARGGAIKKVSNGATGIRL